MFHNFKFEFFTIHLFDVGEKKSPKTIKKNMGLKT